MSAEQDGLQIRPTGRTTAEPLHVSGPYGVVITLPNGTEFRVRPTDDGTGLTLWLQDTPTGVMQMGVRPVSGNVAEVVAL